MKPFIRVTNRPDREIFAAARRALDLDPAVPGGVRVHVDGAIATLTGTVRTLAERAEAEDAVRSVDGVLAVVNEIFLPKIPPQGFEPPNEVNP